MAFTISVGSSEHLSPDQLRGLIADCKNVDKENVSMEFVIDYPVQDSKTPRVKEIVITTYIAEAQTHP